jgi:hypothetical protein
MFSLMDGVAFFLLFVGLGLHGTISAYIKMMSKLSAGNFSDPAIFIPPAEVVLVWLGVASAVYAVWARSKYERNESEKKPHNWDWPLA